MIFKYSAMVLLAIFCLSAGMIKADELKIADFSTSKLDGWENKHFSGTTRYKIVPLDGQNVLSARSKDAASGLFKQIRVDLRKYPYLNWRWRIENRLNITNEKVKPGDDYAARVYIVIDGGILVWRTLAISYVWANASIKGETWPNAFAGKNAAMVAVRDKADQTGSWYFEKRNVFEDLKKLFGREIEHIDAVAIMTDTDNSHGQAEAYYGDITFSAK